MFIYDISIHIQHLPRMAFWFAKSSSPNPWFFMRRCGQRTAMDAPVLTLPLPREAVLQGYQVQDWPVTMSDQTAADCRSHALGFNCNIPRIDSKQNILTGFFVEFWNLIKVHSLESGARDLGPNSLRCTGHERCVSTKQQWWCSGHTVLQWYVKLLWVALAQEVCFINRNCCSTFWVNQGYSGGINASPLYRWWKVRGWVQNGPTWP